MGDQAGAFAMHAACARETPVPDVVCYRHGCANALIAESDRCRMLSPLLENVIKFRASLYADDLLVFAAPLLADRGVGGLRRLLL
jgi:hypothetical protein